MIYEGAPDYPEKDRYWEIIERYGVTVFYTSPTAIRLFMKWGAEQINKCEISSLRLLGTVGEPLNPEVWRWYPKTLAEVSAPSLIHGGRPRQEALIRG